MGIGDTTAAAMPVAATYGDDVAADPDAAAVLRGVGLLAVG